MEVNANLNTVLHFAHERADLLLKLEGMHFIRDFLTRVLAYVLLKKMLPVMSHERIEISWIVACLQILCGCSNELLSFPVKGTRMLRIYNSFICSSHS